MSNQSRNRLYKQLIHIIHRPRAKANYLLRAKRANGRGIHSPFLYRFITIVLNTKWPYYAFKELESTDKKKQNVFDIAFNHHKQERIAQTVFRIVQDQQPNSILEIGNSNGIETNYMASACPKAFIYSLSSSSDFKDYPSLKTAFSAIENIDFVLFNTPADRIQSMKEFRNCLRKVHENTIFVCKHIHHTPAQGFAWKRMRNHPEVRASIDLYDLGILFFRRDLPKCRLRIKT